MPKEITLSDKKKNVFQKEVLEAVKQPTDVQTPRKETKEKPQIKKELKEKTREEKKIRKPMKKWLVIFLVVLGILLVAGGLFAFYYFGIFTFVKDPSEVITFPTDYLTTQVETESLIWESIELLEPDEPRTEESPLNGKLFTLEEMTEMLDRRPVAVMVNNHVDARPQSGLNSADLVFETLVESGITRYMAVFWSEAPEKVGSVRSARNYYLEWLSPLDAIYIHDGCASSTNTSADACTNLYTYGIKDIATYGAWRLDDGIRISPHNEYNSITNAWEYASTLDWDEFPDIESWSFKSDATPENRGEESVIQIAFHTRLTNSGDYDVNWKYDPDTNTYLRRVGGEIDIDQETNTQVWAKNIVIQEVQTSSAYDGTAHILVKTIDSGNAVFLIDGQVIEGTWEKKSRTDRTTYYDSDGKEIEFNRGRIWIEAVSIDDGRFDIIE